jgi:hypothetical protein
MNRKTTFEKDVARTILAQIEGTYSGTINIAGENHKISALKTIGASDFVYGKDFVQFKVKGAKDFNKVKVSLNVKDLYDIELWAVGVVDDEPFIICDKVDEYNDVFFSELGNLLVKEVCYRG